MEEYHDIGVFLERPVVARLLVPAVATVVRVVTGLATVSSGLASSTTSTLS